MTVQESVAAQDAEARLLAWNELGRRDSKMESTYLDLCRQFDASWDLASRAEDALLDFIEEAGELAGIEKEKVYQMNRKCFPVMPKKRDGSAGQSLFEHLLQCARHECSAQEQASDK